jgi:hypothetical protein
LATVGAFDKQQPAVMLLMAVGAAFVSPMLLVLSRREVGMDIKKSDYGMTLTHAGVTAGLLVHAAHLCNFDLDPGS